MYQPCKLGKSRILSYSLKGPARWPILHLEQAMLRGSSPIGTAMLFTGSWPEPISSAACLQLWRGRGDRVFVTSCQSLSWNMKSQCLVCKPRTSYMLINLSKKLIIFLPSTATVRLPYIAEKLQGPHKLCLLLTLKAQLSYHPQLQNQDWTSPKNAVPCGNERSF